MDAARGEDIAFQIAQSKAQRKAVGIIATDMALFYAGNSILQSANLIADQIAVQAMGLHHIDAHGLADVVDRDAG